VLLLVVVVKVVKLVEMKVVVFCGGVDSVYYMRGNEPLLTQISQQ